jgi:hypothetical protein
MTSIAEALGLTLPGAASIPAADAAHPRMATACGRRIVDMVWEDLKPSDILDRRSFENALIVHNALAGSTNAMIHLVALARRAGVELKLTDFDDFAQKVPVIANLRPSGAWLMEDFHIAGGIRGLLKRLEGMLHLEARTVTGTLADALDGAGVYNDDVIRPLDKPIAASGGTAILYGNLAPDGCVIKPPAAEARLLQHTGPAIVFDTYDEMSAAVKNPDLDVTPDHIMVFRNGGPIGGPGMPEWGMLPIPQKLLKQGVRDLLRISDARMSGTSYGACILHVSPEAHIGGPLAAVRNGDLITGGRVQALHPPAPLGRRDRRALEGLVAPTAELRARLQPPLRPACAPGPRRLRFRLPGRQGRDSGAGDSLGSSAPRSPHPEGSRSERLEGRGRLQRSRLFPQPSSFETAFGLLRMRVAAIAPRASGEGSPHQIVVDVVEVDVLPQSGERRGVDVAVLVHHVRDAVKVGRRLVVIEEGVEQAPLVPIAIMCREA